MGIALLALSELLTPLQSLAHRWLPSPAARRRRTSALDLEPGLRYVQVRPGRIGTGPDNAPATRALRPLRVVRVTEAGKPRPGGRLVLSGRLEDVCAELDRLAALEAAQGGASKPARQLH